MKTLSGKRGTALITSLMIMAVMASVAVSLSQNMMVTISRHGHVSERDQAFWYALGARDFAEGALLQSLPEAGDPMRPTDAWAQGPRYFEIDNGHLVGEVRDASNCFNLNSLVPATGQANAAREANADAFISLMQALNIPAGEAQAIAAQATDWIDADNRPGARGAEDSDYRMRSIPHRAANAPFVEREELLSLPAMRREVFEIVAPLVCAHPVAEPSPLNLNTLRSDQVALLAAYLDDALSVSDLALVLSRRPSTGFNTVEEFWTDPLIASAEIAAEDRPPFALNTRYFEILVDVRQGESRYRLFESVELTGAGRLERHMQRFGVFS